MGRVSPPATASGRLATDDRLLNRSARSCTGPPARPVGHRPYGFEIGWSWTIVAVCSLCLGAPAPAWAYLEPGAATLLWQLLLAALFGLSLHLRRVFRWVQQMIRRIRPPRGDGRPRSSD